MIIRFLLPCNANADREAIDAAVEVAHSYGATLVPLLLRSTLEIKTTQPKNRNDFLEIVHHQAAIMDVPIEEFEISTHDAGPSIRAFAEEMNCSGILLFLCEGKGILLETNEVQYVIEHEHIILPFLVRLIHKKKAPSLSSRISRRIQSEKILGTFQRNKAFPLWYPFALLAAGLIIVVLVFLNGLYLLKEPTFSLVSLLAKLIFIGIIALSLIALLKFFVEKWRREQE